MQANGHPLDALSDPTRRQVLELLRSGPRSLGELAAELPVSRPAVSQHLRVLEKARLVTSIGARGRGTCTRSTQPESERTGIAAFAARSEAIELFDERLEIHGFYGTQVRAIARDWSPSDGIDLTQWYHILNIEAEADLAPRGFGPFDVLQAFVRVDVRYDCVWTRACSIFHSADAFGDRARKLPKRLNDGRRSGYRPSGTLFTGDTRRFADLPREFLAFDYRDRPDGSFRPSELFDIEGIDTLFGSRGVDGSPWRHAGPRPASR